MLSIIVAVAENHAIGKDNNLLWHISEDLKYFKRITTGHAIIMGRRTFESIGSKPLPKRLNIVISRTLTNQTNQENLKFVTSLDEALKELKDEDENFIIGGGMLYKTSFSLADRLYITEVCTTIDSADTFFPAISNEDWQKISIGKYMTDEKSGLKFRFVTYAKIKKDEERK